MMNTDPMFKLAELHLEEDMKEINENEATFVSKITSLTTSFPR